MPLLTCELCQNLLLRDGSCRACAEVDALCKCGAPLWDEQDWPCEFCGRDQTKPSSTPTVEVPSLLTAEEVGEFIQDEVIKRGGDPKTIRFTIGPEVKSDEATGTIEWTYRTVELDVAKLQHQAQLEDYLTFERKRLAILHEEMRNIEVRRHNILRAIHSIKAEQYALDKPKAEPQSFMPKPAYNVTLSKPFTLDDIHASINRLFGHEN